MDIRKAHARAEVIATLHEWMAVHGNLCLALRHPENTGPSRALIVGMIHRIGKILVEGGALTEEELNFATRVEQEEYGLEKIQ